MNERLIVKSFGPVKDLDIIFRKVTLFIGDQGTGKSCVAKGVRKEKSKLAGGIEMFTVSDIVIHESEKSDMGILTSAKMTKSYMNIISDLDRFELGSKVIKMTNKISENVDSPELFSLVNQCFWALDKNLNRELIESYFLFNLMRISGEDVNLHRDTLGDKLDAETTYAWDTLENALRPEPRGNVKAEHIKLMQNLTKYVIVIEKRRHFLWQN